MKIETRRRRGHRRRPPRPHARRPGRAAGRQPRLRQLGGADEPVAGRGGGRPRSTCRAPATPTSSAPGSTARPTCATCSSAPAPARRRRASPAARWPRRSCARSASRSARHVVQIGSVARARARRGAHAAGLRRRRRRPGPLPRRRGERARWSSTSTRQRKANESLGGVFEVLAFGARARARLARLLGGAPRRPPRRRAVLDPGGQGRRARRRRSTSPARPGSEAHDEIFYSDERGYYRETNRAGGLEGGMTTGEPLVVARGDEADARR